MMLTGAVLTLTTAATAARGSHGCGGTPAQPASIRGCSAHIALHARQ